jgi:hypothetical protein
MLAKLSIPLFCFSSILSRQLVALERNDRIYVWRSIKTITLVDQLGIAWINMMSDREGCNSKNESNALLMNLRETHVRFSCRE